MKDERNRVRQFSFVENFRKFDQNNKESCFEVVGRDQTDKKMVKREADG